MEEASRPIVSSEACFIANSVAVLAPFVLLTTLSASPTEYLGGNEIVGFLKIS